MLGTVDAALTRLSIEAYTEVERTGTPVATVEAMFNPTQYGFTHTVTYEQEQGAGDASSPQNFKAVQPVEYAFELVYDGTGTARDKVDVHRTVQDFLAATSELDGDIHRPRYLKVSWGTLLVHCVLKTAAVTYTLFAPDGSPLRAKIAATFAESVDDERRVAEERKQSPDLTHEREVHQGERLPLLADRIYREPGRYLQLAKANRLRHFRRLQPGQTLVFPPIQDVTPA